MKVGSLPANSRSMLTLTEMAAGKVKELLAEEGRDDIALRVAVSPGGCSGLRYAMYLDDQASEKDTVEEQHGVRIVIDKMSVPYLSQATVDFIDSLEQTGFTIDNPAAQGGCANQRSRCAVVRTDGPFQRRHEGLASIPRCRFAAPQP